MGNVCKMIVKANLQEIEEIKELHSVIKYGKQSFDNAHGYHLVYFINEVNAMRDYLEKQSLSYSIADLDGFGNIPIETNDMVCDMLLVR